MLKRLKMSFLLAMLIPIFTGCTNEDMDSIIIAKLLDDGVITDSVNIDTYKLYNSSDKTYLMCETNNSLNNEYVCITYNMGMHTDMPVYYISGFNVIWDGMVSADNMPVIEQNILDSEFNATYSYENGVLMRI